MRTWAGTPQRGANALPKLGQAPPAVAKPIKTAAQGEPSALTFGLELPPTLTNKDAKAAADKLMDEIERRAAKKKAAKKKKTKM